MRGEAVGALFFAINFIKFLERERERETLLYSETVGVEGSGNRHGPR